MLTARLSHIGLRVPDPPEVANFYGRVLGLRVAETGPDGLVRLGCGAGFHALELSNGEGFGHLGLELPDGAALRALERRLREHGVPLTAQSLDGAHPEVLGFEDADGNRIEAHTPGLAARAPVGLAAQAPAGSRCPVRIHHVTLGTAQLEAQLEFYEDVMGFRVSDRIGNAFAWLRCNHEHHTVALVEADAAGLDHYAYEILSWGELKDWCDHLAALHVALQWGPGRHGPGNNIFVMFDDSAGNRIELSCEMEHFWDDLAEYPPRVWRAEPSTINLWGPSPEWRGSVVR
jgi:catechol-2,3-dioxygenase